MVARYPSIAHGSAIAPLRILMCGPQVQMPGGMASVVRLYLAGWDETAAQLRYIPSFSHASRLAKALLFGHALLRYLICLIRWRPHLVHLHFSWRGSTWRKLILLSMALMLGIPVLLHCHSSRFPQFYESLPRSLQRLILAGFNRAAAILILNEHMRDYFTAIGVHSPLCLLPNPVAIPASLNQPSQTVILLYLGDIVPHKGLQDLLRAAAPVLRQRQDVQLHLAGLGPADEIARLRELSQALGITSQVIFRGWLDEAAKAEALRHAYLLVQPSHAEGMPLAVLEALAAGLPVVATQVGALPEMITHGRQGLLLPAGDIEALTTALAQLLADSSLRDAMAQQAHLRAAEAYDVRAVLPRLYALYGLYAADAR